MHTLRKLSSRNLATGLLIILIFSVNHVVAVLTSSNSSNNLHDLATRSSNTTRLTRTSSLGELTSSESGSSDGESDRSSGTRRKLNCAGAAVASVLKRASMAMDADRKLVFIRDRWERECARKKARTKALEARVVTPTAVHTIDISPIVAKAAHTSVTGDVDLGDAVPSQTRTTRILSLICSPLVARKIPATISPASPIPTTYRSACLEFWFEKAK